MLKLEKECFAFCDSQVDVNNFIFHLIFKYCSLLSFDWYLLYTSDKYFHAIFKKMVEWYLNNDEHDKKHIYLHFFRSLKLYL